MVFYALLCHFLLKLFHCLYPEGCSPWLRFYGISFCRRSRTGCFSNQWRFVFGSPVARLILFISEPSGFTSSLVNWPHLPLETPLRVRISIGSTFDGQTFSCVRVGMGGAAPRWSPSLKSAEVLSALEQCVIATQQPGSPDTESDISTQQRK